MLLIVGAVIVLIAVARVVRVRARGADGHALGYMSERWLAEQRTSHSG